MKTDSDAIVAMARKLMLDGNGAVEEEFATAILPVVKGMVARRLDGRDRADFDDLVQEITWALITQLRARRLKDENSVLAYLRSIVVNTLHHQYRATRNLCDLSEAFGVRHPDPSPEAAIIHKHVAELEFDVLQSVLDSIPSLNLEVVGRFYIDEQSKEEICESLKITDTQFRLAKSRTKVLVTRLLSKRLQQSSSTG
jgi:RNA polymerase sigma factor (sigma-70 family)